MQGSAVIADFLFFFPFFSALLSLSIIFLSAPLRDAVF